jgi:hypothetical protein
MRCSSPCATQVAECAQAAVLEINERRLTEILGRYGADAVKEGH